MNEAAGRTAGFVRGFKTTFARSRLRQVGYSLADQALAVGGGFLVNVVLAPLKPRKNMDVRPFLFGVRLLLGLYHAAILEPYTIYGAGRYRDRFSEYLRLIARRQRDPLSPAERRAPGCVLVFSRISPQLTSQPWWVSH